jgi:hypothetical protein
MFLTLVRKRGQFAIQICGEKRESKISLSLLQHLRVEDRTQVFGETKVKHKLHMYIHPSRGKVKRTQNYIIIELQSYRSTKLLNISFTLFAYNCYCWNYNPQTFGFKRKRSITNCGCSSLVLIH